MRIPGIAANSVVDVETPVGHSDEPRSQLRAIVDEYGDFLWRTLRRLGVCEADLADAAQQVFLVVARRIADIRPGSERSFTFQTALRVAANVQRTRHRRREISDDALFEHNDMAPDPESCAEQRRRRAQLDAILECLSLDVRAVFVLSELEGISVAEIALLLDIPAGTAASRLRRGRKQFDALVKRLHARERSQLP